MKLLGPFVSILLIASVSGCKPQHPPTQSSQTIPFKLQAIPTPGDPKPHTLYVAQVDVYQIDVPFGTVSQNLAFWEKIDQQNIPAEQNELLSRNGFRVGQGLVADWDYFQAVLEKNPAHTHVTSRIAYQEEHESFLTRADQPATNLFYFDQSGNLIGRSVDAADDELFLSFWPTPRHDGQVHIQLVPGVKIRAEQIKSVWTDGQETMERYRPEFFYDLKLESDIDVNHFLVVAPSSEAKLSSSLGHAFLTNSAGAARTETILIIVARPIGAGALVKSNR
ncbi:MAG TPA: hypothetical protein VGG19_01150 [Tepidisphaeraceae bacterium]|jgi:hypothetical protein